MKPVAQEMLREDTGIPGRLELLQTQPRVDDLFSELENCQRDDERRSQGLDAERLAHGRLVAEGLFRLNDLNRSSITTLVQATAVRLATEFEDGFVSHSSTPERFGMDLHHDEEFDLARLLQNFGPTDAYYRVMDAMNAPVSNASRVAEAMADTPMLAAFALRLVNGPSYGLISRVNSLPRAVAMAGYNEISGLALAVHLSRQFIASSDDAADSPWLKSMLCGVFARKLAKSAGLPGDWFFAAGLLADIGTHGVQMVAGQALERAHDRARAEHLPRHVAESLELGMSMSEVGARLLEHWDAPRELVGMIRLREDPSRAQYAPAICVLHVAEIMAQAASVSGPDSLPVSRLDDHALSALGLSSASLEANQAAALLQAEALAESFTR